MADQIYILTDGDVLQPVASNPYANEEDLQGLLVRHPALLAGEQIDPEDPRRWILIKREAPVLHRGTEVYRWRMDHLFLDQEGVPTLVETKLAANPELRRKVVGQMLDYASNLASDWSVERIQREFGSRCEEQGLNPETELANHLSGDIHLDSSPDVFWDEVQSNLEKGRLRLLFVADRVPSALLKIVEFLNEQMSPCEVFAIELRQYAFGEGTEKLKTLVPRVHGLAAVSRSRARRKRVVADSGSYVLEGVADKFELEFGMHPRIRSHRRGWVRLDDPNGPGDGEWLIYQSRQKGTLNLYFDGGAGAGISEEEQQRIRFSLKDVSFQPGVQLKHGYSIKEERFWVGVEISGFDPDDESNWEDLRGFLKRAMRQMLDSWPRDE